MRIARLSALVWALVWLAAATALPTPARADDFYKGKTVTIVVGFSPGGGFDLNARLLGRYIGRYIPGTPDVVVVNAPGAGSEAAVVRLDMNFPTDGTVIDTFNFGLINDSLLQPQKTKVDFRNYAWIGSISEDLTVCYVWRDNGPKTIAQMKERGHYFFGLTGVGVSDDINTKILRRIFGVDITQVTGYPGSAEVRLAIQRGELDGDCGAWSSIPEDMIKQAKFSPVSRSSMVVPEGMSPDVPYVLDAAPDDEARKLVRFLLADSAIGRPFIVSRTVPAERVRILREAFTAALQDKDLIADAKRERFPLSPKTGEEAAKAIDDIYATPPATVEAARKIVTE
jgi:tripartite-type tricarboxylate transporter receptor subunit TctC